MRILGNGGEVSNAQYVHNEQKQLQNGLTFWEKLALFGKKGSTWVAVGSVGLAVSTGNIPVLITSLLELAQGF